MCDNLVVTVVCVDRYMLKERYWWLWHMYMYVRTVCIEFAPPSPHFVYAPFNLSPHFAISGEYPLRFPITKCVPSYFTLSPLTPFATKSNFNYLNLL